MNPPEGIAKALRLRLFFVSSVALIAELALIRYIGSEVRIFAYFTNLILIACFLGFGLGYYRSGSVIRLGGSFAAVSGVFAIIAVSENMRWAWGPGLAVETFSNFAGSLTMGEQQASSSVETAQVVVGALWTLALFLGSLASMYGFAQRIGADIEAFGSERRLHAYSINVVGSLVGILLFSLGSHYALDPVYWFAAVAVGTIPYLPRRGPRVAALLCTPIVALFLIEPPSVTWSAYQKLRWSPQGSHVTVNGVGYMGLESQKVRATPLQKRGLDRFRLPHTIKPQAQNVLIIGAGGGNDVSAALEAGARSVVAVEIDRRIYELGREHHPDAPYSDPRVKLVIDDARHYGETTDDRFDLIIFSHLDSHTALSGFTNVRLDNYIYTVESFETFRKLLSPNGALYLSFWATRDWVAHRLSENLRLAFGSHPVALWYRVKAGYRDVINVHFVATADEVIRVRATELRAPPFEGQLAGTPPVPSTDEWPFLFSREKRVPTGMMLLAMLLGTVVGVTILLLVRSEMKTGHRRPIDRHFFFLGAAFLLVEVHNVSRLARVFGTTWAVNAWVIGGILSVIVLANMLAMRWPKLTAPAVAYPPLLFLLLAGFFTPLSAIMHLPLAPVVATLFYTSPLLFAGLIFAGSFRSAVEPSRALGSNILGALLGGFLELAAFVVELPGLLVIAAGLYLFSIPRGRQLSGSSAPASGPSSPGSSEVE